ncbi:Transcriptional regulator [Shewanella benthica]|uniref:Transcriptional regulator n=2 Tax=Shewanella benthica TaxID=43661 RepID=A0A330M5A0_9GAMM|nr:Transcriptional regulator [Shewanella benthica]
MRINMENTLKTKSNAKKINLQSCDEPCLIERGMRILGGKWKASILWHVKDGPVRFNELSRMLGGASKKMVDQRLKELESQGLVSREVICTRPIAVTYEITDFGRTALEILEKLKDWTEENKL